MGKMDELCV
jgi:predicted NUDIX family phosphoesterase